MDDENICEAFILGFCPYEEFQVSNVTKECPKVHKQSMRDVYQSSHVLEIPLGNGVLELKNMVKDLDKKIVNSKDCLNEMQTENDTCKAIEKIEDAINSRNLEDNEDLYTLIKIHGHLIMNTKNCSAPMYDVCAICGSFKKVDQECAHKFCSTYKKLRELVKLFGKNMHC